MKAVFMKGLDDIVIRDIELRKPGLGEIRVRVDACGICGTDVTSALDGSAEYRQFGHEVAGTVLETGHGVENVRSGQKVILESSSPCGMCAECRNARQELCTNVRSFFGTGTLGFAQEMISPALSAIPYEGVTPEEACLSEPLGVAVDMHRLAGIEVGSVCVVSGLGAIGLMAVRLAKLSGAQKIYACNYSDSGIRLQTAKKFGADEAFAVKDSPLEARKFPRPPDRFMVTSPPETLASMVKVSAKGGIISYVGIKYGKGAALTFDANEFHFKKLQLRGSFASPALYTAKALELITSGAVDAGALVTHRFRLADIKEAMRVAAKDHAKAIKVVIIP